MRVVVIPSRYGSKRFPGKPLVSIAGRSLISRVWAIAKAAKQIDRVLIATDDDRIAVHCRDFGAEVVMTPAQCENGTERVFAALQQLKIEPQVVVNLQGDAVLTPPAVIDSLCSAMLADSTVQICTPAVRLSSTDYRDFVARRARSESGGTFVTFDLKGNALYFSKQLIPYIRDGGQGQLPVFRHIGMYAYTVAALRQYLKLPATPLEKAEKLEQLRALENGVPLRVVLVDYGGRTHASVDTPEDAEVAAKIIKSEGELV